MRSVALPSALFLSLFATVAVFATEPVQRQATPSVSSTPAEPAAPAPTSSKGDGDRPLQISFGPQDGGGFGLTAKGSAYYPMLGHLLDRPRPNYSISAFAYLSPDVNFTAGASKTNQAAISLRPTFQFGYQPDSGGFGNYPANRMTIWPQAAPFATLYADGRRQYGEFAQTPGGATEPFDSTLVGVGGSIAVPYFTRLVEKGLNRSASDFDPFALPMIHLVWYHEVNHKSDLPLPEGITADQLDISLNTSYTLGAWVQGGSSVLPRIDFNGDLSRPTTGANRKWKSKVDVAVSAKVNGSSFRPVIAYTSGQKLGLKYDKQLLFGLALEWLTRKP
ncbi:MAG: hypothetical protein ABI837_08070 [Acidobacteriota bacterium]